MAHENEDEPVCTPVHGVHHAAHFMTAGIGSSLNLKVLV